MLDLQLPRPLLNPSLWPSSASEKETWLLSLAHLKHGGAFANIRNVHLGSSAASHLSFAVPETFWSREALEEPSFVALLDSEFVPLKSPIDIVSRTPLQHHEQEKWRALGERSGKTIRFVTKPDLVLPTSLDWSKEIFPESFRESGDVHWYRELKDYESQMKASMLSMDRFRYWPGFLKARNLPFATTAAIEWANAQALFSPQDDEVGTGDFLILNPTAEVVIDSRLENELARAVWRFSGTLNSKQLNWQEAAVIDELRETPRVSYQHLVSEMKAKRYPFKNEVNFEALIDSLVRQGLVLRRG